MPGSWYYRVFDRNDLFAAIVDFGQRRVQRRGLARAGGARYQQHAVGFLRQVAQRDERRRVEPQRFERERAVGFDHRALVEDTDHRIFAVNARHDRHAQVDVAPGRLDTEAPVLRHAALGDIEFGQHFQARDDVLGQLDAAHCRRVIEHAVDAVFHGQAAGRAFQVDVRGAGFQRVVQRGVDQLDGRAARFGHRRERQHGANLAVAPAVGSPAHERIDGARRFLLLGQVGLNVGLLRQAQCERPAGRGAGLGAEPRLQVEIERIGHDADQAPVGVTQQRAVA